MSVRSFFGQINSPEFGDKIVYANADGLVKLIKGMEINGDAGSGDQAVCSDGNGGVEWRTLTDQGVTSTLGEVMTAGASASADLDMTGHNITSNTELHMVTGGKLTLLGTLGVDFGTGVGNEGSVLSSNGALPPTWIVPKIPSATADLDMTGHNITDCTGVVNPDGVTFGVVGAASFSDAVSFNALPTCAGQPDADDQLVNKIYVDELVAGAEGVSPGLDANWSVLQTFNAGLIVTSAISATFNGGAFVPIMGASYSAAHPAIANYYSYGGAGQLSLQSNTWMINWGADSPGDVALPVVDPGMWGLTVKIINVNSVARSLTVTCGSTLYDVYGGQGNKPFTNCSFANYSFVELLACSNAGNDSCWMATNISGNANISFA